jgi:transposase
MDLKDAQWAVLEPFFKPKARLEKRGRPPQDARGVLNAVLWVLRTGAPWHDLPERYPPYQTCHRWFQQWQQDGTLVELLRSLLADLRDRGKVDLEECFIDATFAGAKKGALELVRRAAAKGPRSWQSQTAMVFLSPCTWPALVRTKPSSWNPRSSGASSRRRDPNG